MTPAVKRAQRMYPVLFSEENGELPALFFMSPSPPPVPPVPEGHAQLPRWSTGHATRAHGLVQAPRALHSSGSQRGSCARAADSAARMPMQLTTSAPPSISVSK